MCLADSEYFSLIYECVPSSISSSPVFVAAYTGSRVCAGGNVTTAAQLAGYRYCNVISSDLVISTIDADADFGALFDVDTFQGFRNHSICIVSIFSPGALVIVNSSVTTLTMLVHATIFGENGAGFSFNGGRYGLVVSGLSFDLD